MLLFAGICLCMLLCACGAESGDDSGRMIPVKDSSGAVTGYERRFVNSDGNVTRLDVFDADEVYLYYVMYEYDDQNRLYSETAYEASGFARDRYIYTYSDDGSLYEKAYELPNGEATVERYDKDGAVIEKLYYGTDEQLYKREALENGEWTTYEGDALIAQEAADQTE